CFFFFQAEDGIRDFHVTGVQTCALPICKEVMLKNKSYFKKSTGDEPGNAPKKGVVTSTHRGKVYFTSWSMDVKFEGENVVRHLRSEERRVGKQGRARRDAVE